MVSVPLMLVCPLLFAHRRALSRAPARLVPPHEARLVPRLHDGR